MRAASYPVRPRHVNRFSDARHERRPDARVPARTMPAMPMRVAFLAAECEPWAKTGGLADVVDALARALGRLDGDAIDDAGRRLPAALPRASRARRRVERDAVARVPDPRAPVGRRPRSPSSTSRPTATGSASSTTRRPSTATGSTATRPATTPTTPGGSGCSAGRRSRRSAPTAGPLDVLHLHDWHTGPAAIYRDARYADDPIVGGAAILMTLHNLAYHGWTPRADARPARAGAGRRRRRRATPTASTCCAPASSGRSSSTRSRRGSRPRR